jgi:PAS domain S-box-containing protein
MAALFGALLALYWVQNAAGRADRAVIDGDQARAALIARMRAAVAREERAVEDREAGRGAAGEVERARNLLPQLLAGEETLERKLAAARRERQAARLRLRNVLLGFGLLGPLAALLINLAGSATGVRRLRLAAENARRLAHGEPLSETVEGTDEIATLARQIRDAAAIMQERERLVSASERRYRDLFDRAPVPYEETDSAGIVRRLNQEVCNLLRCGPERILGSAAWDFVDPDHREQFRADMLDRIARAVEIGPFECEFLLEDGTRLVVEIRESLIRSETGEVAGVCRSLLDVTERKLAAVAARKVAQYANRSYHRRAMRRAPTAQDALSEHVE